MKKLKVLKALGLSLLISLSAAALCACGGNGEGGKETTAQNSSKEATYVVTVTDATGTPVNSGVIVRFMKDGQQASMQVVDENGKVSKEMEKGDYTVELKFTDSNAAFVYDETDLTLTADKTELTISLANTVKGEGVELYVGENGSAVAYNVETGGTMVPLTVGARNYFLFTPKEAGTYEVSITEEGTVLGCYGTPYYVNDVSIYEVVDNTFTMSIRADMISAGEGGSSIILIGIDSEKAENCILSVERIGEPQWSTEDVPFDVYTTTATLAPYKLPAGASVVPFDLKASTDSINLVYNETDGFYHLNTADGPLVLVYLGEDCKYINCYEYILSKTNVSKYFYDEAGTLVKKENYGDCLREYLEYMDEDAGVYPLTEDLKYIIQQHGDHQGWWDMDANTCIFYDEAGNIDHTINPEIAWLLMCGYIAQ